MDFVDGFHVVDVVLVVFAVETTTRVPFLYAVDTLTSLIHIAVNATDVSAMNVQLLE